MVVLESLALSLQMGRKKKVVSFSEEWLFGLLIVGTLAYLFYLGF